MNKNPALVGPRRDHTQVNLLRAPYENGDVVTLQGKEWQVRRGMTDWYLTDTGDWKGEHPSIKGIRGQSELISAVDDAASTIEPQNASQPIQAAESSTRPEPRGQDAATRAEQPRPDGAATARADGGKGAKAGWSPAKTDPRTMTAGKINTELDFLDRYMSLNTDEFIQAGRGNERPSDYLSKTDPLSMRARELRERFSALRAEMQARFGPDVPHRLPAKFGPREQAAAPAPKPMIQAPAKPAPKPLIARKNSEILADLNKQIDTEKRAEAGGPERITLKSGGTTQTISNTAEGVAKWRGWAEKNPGFKDTKTPKPGMSRELGYDAKGLLRNDKTHAADLSKRAPKAVVQDFVAEGDFENASVLAEHYGVDVKAGMDAKQKRAYQDWLDSKERTFTPEWKAAVNASQTSLTVHQGGSPMSVKFDEPVWRMTKDEVEDKIRARRMQGHKDSTLNPLLAEHYKAVKQAVDLGADVPAKVLYDYPNTLRDDLTAGERDIAVGMMVDVYRKTKDYDAAVAAYRGWQSNSDLH